MLPENRLSLYFKSSIKVTNVTIENLLQDRPCTMEDAPGLNVLFSSLLDVSLLSSWSQPSPCFIKANSLWTGELKRNQWHIKELSFSQPWLHKRQNLFIDNNAWCWSSALAFQSLWFHRHSFLGALWGWQLSQWSACNYLLRPLNYCEITLGSPFRAIDVTRLQVIPLYSLEMNWNFHSINILFN